MTLQRNCKERTIPAIANNEMVPKFLKKSRFLRVKPAGQETCSSPKQMPLPEVVCIAAFYMLKCFLLVLRLSDDSTAFPERIPAANTMGGSSP